jgi:hypothetical protein
MNRFYYALVLLALLILSCNRANTVQSNMTKAELIELIGEPDSIQIKEGMPDVYTNKLINIEQWFYGTDTIINMADNKVQNISIQ